jgi:hypothetical protein
MKWLSAFATVALAVTLSVGSSGCKKGEQTTGKGSEGKELTLTAPSGTTDIKQGDTTKVTISVKRKGFEDPVTVSFSDLPKGVKVSEDDMSIPKGKDSADFTLKADNDAPEAKDHTTKVTVKGGGAETSATFKLNVNKK